MAFVKGKSGNPGGRPKKTAAALEVEALAQQAGVDAMERLKSLMDNEDARVVLAACNSILDRAFGKPAQDLNVEQHTTHDLSNISDAQLAAILAEEAGGSRGPTPPPDPEQLH